MLSDAQLRQTGASRATLWRWKRGRSRPQRRYREQLALIELLADLDPAELSIGPSKRLHVDPRRIAVDPFATPRWPGEVHVVLAFMPDGSLCVQPRGEPGAVARALASFGRAIVESPLLLDRLVGVE